MPFSTTTTFVVFGKTVHHWYMEEMVTKLQEQFNVILCSLEIQMTPIGMERMEFLKHILGQNQLR